MRAGASTAASSQLIVGARRRVAGRLTQGTRTAAALGAAMKTTRTVLLSALLVILCAGAASGQDGTWTAKTDAPVPLAQHGAVAIDGTLYMVGGYTGPGCPPPTTDTLAYDIAGDSWTTRAPLTIGRNGLAVAAVDGKIYAIGGGNCVSTFSENEVYDPVTDMWTPQAPLPQARVFMASGAVDGFIYVISGSDGVTGLTNTNYRYDPLFDEWTTVAPIPTPRYQTAAGVVDGILYVVGGSGTDGSVPWNLVEAYDPVSDSWSPRAPMPTPRQGHAVGVVNGILYAIGGQEQGGAPGVNLATVEAYNPLTDMWTPVTAIPGVGRSGASAVDAGGALYVTGGYTASGTLTNHEMFTPDAVVPDTDGATTTTVSSSKPVSAFGESVTFTATVTGSVVTEGTITFKEGASELTGPQALDAAGQASFTTSALSVGTHTITAEYSGSANFDASTGTFIQVVDRATTTTVLTSAPSPSVLGQTVVFTATVASVLPGLGSVTGTVTFKDGGTPFGSAPLSAAGQALLATSALAVGDRAITAEYSGNAIFDTSTAGITHTVDLAATSTTLTSSPNPSVFGQDVTLTAKVMFVAPGARILSFSPPAPFDTGADATYSVATGDFNGDGVPDLATTNRSTDQVSIVLGDGMGGFGSPALFPVGTSPVHVLAADLDADGALDLVTANQGSANISVLGGNGDGTFGAPVNFATGTASARPSGIALGDFDADGDLDLAIANAAIDPVTAGQNTVTIVLGDGSLGFGSTGNFAVGTTPVHIVAADFNHDGVLDIATANAGTNTVSIRVGTGTGTLGTLTNFTMAGGGTSPRAVVVGDFNGDLKPDFASANFGTASASGSVSVRLNTGGAPGVLSFGAASTLSLGASPDASLIRPDFMVGGDFNGDGTFDLALTDSNHALVSILTGRGTGAFAFPMRFNSGLSGRRLAAADLNGDEALDLAIPTLMSNGNVLLNTGAGPTGTMQFMDGVAALGGPVPIVGGIASMVTSTLAVGSHALSAEYSGDANYGMSVGNFTQVVDKANTTTTVTSSLNPSAFGQSTIFTATVAPVAGTPAGTVQFLDAGTPIGSAVTLVGGVGTFVTSALTAGDHTITAEYSGDDNFIPSIGTFSQTVNKADTTTAVTSSLNPSLFGQSVMFTATVTVAPPGAGTPTGTVQFLDSGTPIGIPVTLSAGVTSISTALLAAGNHTIAAEYSGSGNFQSSSHAIDQLVNEETAAPILSLTKSVDKTTANPGDALVYTLTYSNTGTGAATGVTISDVVPASTSFVSASHGGTNTAGTVSWAIGNVAAGTSGSVTLTVSVSSSLPCQTDDEDDDDSDRGRKGHRHDDDEDCLVTVTNGGAITSTETPGLTVSNTVTTQVTVRSGRAKGRMTGGGTFGSEKVQHAFTLNCDPRRGSDNLEVNWGKGNRFKLEGLTSAACLDDPLINPRQPSASFDTYRGTGVGRYNGVRATAEWIFTDAGEPGNHDTATIVIRNAAGGIVLSASGTLSKGNHQAH